MKVDQALEMIRKQHGGDSLISFTGDYKDNVDIIPSGSLALDAAIGVGGYPRGRVTEILGWEGSGKTTIALEAIAQAQKAGIQCVYIDAEHALDIEYAKAIGVDLDMLFINQPEYGEKGLNIMDACIRSGAFGLVVVDSVAALVPQAELNGETGDAHMGLAARMMGQHLRRISGVLKQNNVAAIFINQWRHSMGGGPYGPSKVGTGGNALKYYASLRLDVSRTGTVGSGDDSSANTIKVKVIKNKVAPPYREAKFDIEFGEGISKEGEVIDFSEKLGLIRRKGSWYTTLDGETLAQGKEKMKLYLLSNLEFYEVLREQVRENLYGRQTND